MIVRDILVRITMPAEELTPEEVTAGVVFAIAGALSIDLVSADEREAMPAEETEYARRQLDPPKEGGEDDPGLSNEAGEIPCYPFPPTLYTQREEDIDVFEEDLDPPFENEVE